MSEATILHTVPIGDVELSVLEDGTWEFPARAFFGNAPEAAWRAQLDTDEDGRIPVGHNCALVNTGRELVLIDTGYGGDTHDGCTGHLLEELDRAGYRASDVTRVVNTHAHGDHIKGNTVLRAGRRSSAFPFAAYYLGRSDWDWFKGLRGRVHGFDAHLGSLESRGLLTLVDAALQLTPEVLLWPTPGHTPGHTSVLIESQGQTAIFLGDLCHHALHFSNPEWVSTFDTHPSVTQEIRATLFDWALEHDSWLICPHETPPGLGRLKQADDRFLWEAAA